MAKIYDFIVYRGGQYMNKVTVFDVAKAFLSMESMTNKKLQKLCYYAQAWHLAFYKVPLFENSFEAWVHGPVCPDLYHFYKAYGWNFIPKEDSIPDIINGGKLELINNVYDTYSNFSGDQLEYLSHSELPWIKAREGYEEWQPSHENIDENLMEKFYWAAYEKSQQV